MALKNVQRITFSLPKTTVLKLEIFIPKNKRSKFVAEAIIKNLSSKNKNVTLEAVSQFWDQLAKSCPRKTTKTAAESQREDRLSH